jgi:hypothetical protein
MLASLLPAQPDQALGEPAGDARALEPAGDDEQADQGENHRLAKARDGAQGVAAGRVAAAGRPQQAQPQQLADAQGGGHAQGGQVHAQPVEQHKRQRDDQNGQ